MSSQLAIIIAIDIQAALNAGTLSDNVYLIDNNKFRGSRGEGSQYLITAVQGNQIMNWLAIGIDLGFDTIMPVIKGIGGKAVNKRIMVPQQFESPELGDGLGLWWGATVDKNRPGVYPYKIYFDIDGIRMDLKSYVNVKPGFSNVNSGESAKSSLQYTSESRSVSNDYPAFFSRFGLRR